MRIIKPYGSTRTSPRDGDDAVRKIHPNSFRENSSDVEAFVTSHPKLVLAQWLSLIDKVITKPAEGSSPSLDQLNLREEVGTAAWEIIVSKELLDSAPKRLKRLEREWWSKIHPYDKESEPTGVLDFRGRWFATFSKERDAKHVDGIALAEALYDHLYVNERHIVRTLRRAVTNLIKIMFQKICNSLITTDANITG